MADRPYTLLSCGMSLDGYLDSADVARLRLSNDADFERVDAVRAGCDAIAVGATTVRNDNPRLMVRSAERRSERVARGLPPSPLKVTLTRSGDLDPEAAFFRTGETQKLVYCPSPTAARLRARLGAVATVVGAGPEVDIRLVCEDLSARGVNRLMVEGGGTLHTQFLTGDLADELQLVVAPFFVGDSRACRFVGDGRFPWTAERRAPLAEVRQIGDVVLLRYALSPRFGEE
jgi:5-amino-6-(5-phosphoribosylamino)uracil reductase